MSTADAPLLSIGQLEVTYQGSMIAIQGVSIDCAKGSIISVIGTNGAGKTTLLRAVSGFLPGDHARITDGHIRFDGSDIKGLPPYRVARRGIALVPERDLVFTTLSVEENLEVVSTRKSASTAIAEIMELFPALRERRRERAGYLSGGERKMLAIARGLLLKPRLLLIDELSFGLAPAIVAQLTDVLHGIRRELGVTMLVVEQNASVAIELADYIYVLESGSVVFDGNPKDVSAHEDVREFYLGLSADSAVRSYADVKTYRRVRRWSS